MSTYAPRDFAVSTDHDDAPRRTLAKIASGISLIAHFRTVSAAVRSESKIPEMLYFSERPALRNAKVKMETIKIMPGKFPDAKGSKILCGRLKEWGVLGAAKVGSPTGLKDLRLTDL